MARNAQVSCPAGSWTELTNSENATGDVSVMLSGDVPVSIQATATGTAPTDDVGPFYLLAEGDGWSEATIVAKFPGVASAVRLWAKPLSEERPAVVAISYA